MRYQDRPEFPYDPAVFNKKDTQMALRIYDEATRKLSGRPAPIFFEVDRRTEVLDPLWHAPQGGRETLARRFSIECINHFQKNEWTMSKLGMIPQRRDDFTLSHLSLIRADWFPQRGDYVLHNGYRYMVIHVEIPGEAYWHQTNVWLGLQLRCVIPPEGDGRPQMPTADELRQLAIPSVVTTVVQSPPYVPGSQPL